MRNLSLYSSFATKMRKEEKKKKRTISVNNNQKITGADIESLFRQLNHKKKMITSFLDVNRKKKRELKTNRKISLPPSEKKKKREVRKRGTA